MDHSELHDRLTAGAPIQGADLSAIDWQDADYDAPVFIDCQFTAVGFNNTKFQGGRFKDCRFARCRFAHADLREAVFEACGFVDRTGDPEGCGFAFSDLRSARFARCDLSFAVFERCDLFSIELERCNLLGADFIKVDFSHAYSRKVVSTKATFRSCNLELAGLAGLRLPTCDLSGSRLREANLDQADLSDADLRDCDLFQTTLNGARLDRADLTGAEISGLNLLALAGFARMKISAVQQYALLSALGVEVEP